jgi:hypothetical protein
MELRQSLLTSISAIVFAAASLPGTVSAQTPPDHRIVVVGEVQGAANTISALLEHLELIDSTGHWTGGEAILIQMGDLIDDGANVRATLDLFMGLQQQASTAGGKVIVLMGNHEASNILGDFSDVHRNAYTSFAGPQSESRRQQMWNEWSAWRARRAEAVGESFDAGADVKDEWLADHPPGWVEYAEAMRPEGDYGAWLRSLPVAVEIDDVLFVHGGFNRESEERDVSSINRRAAEEIRSFDEYRERMVSADLCLPLSSAGEMVNVINQEAVYLNGLEDSERTTSNPRVARLLELQHLSQFRSWSILDGTGPLRFWGPARWPEDEHVSDITAILENFSVDRLVTGQSDGANKIIQPRFDNRVVLTAVDMTDDPEEHGGDPAALEIIDDDFFVVTLDGRELLIDG